MRDHETQMESDGHGFVSHCLASAAELPLVETNVKRRPVLSPSKETLTRFSRSRSNGSLQTAPKVNFSQCPPIDNFGPDSPSHQQRPSTTTPKGFGWQASFDNLNDWSCQGRGLETLEEENRALKEELARLWSGSMELYRRPLAAIAGGGFKGAMGLSKACTCDELRMKLHRLRAELRELKRAAGESLSPSRQSAYFSSNEVEVQTLSASSPRGEDASTATDPQADPQALPICCEAFVQTQSICQTCEVSIQVLPAPTEQNSCATQWATTQTQCKTSREVGLQVAPSLLDSAVQAVMPAVSLTETPVQTDACHTAELQVQAGSCLPSSESGVQTDLTTTEDAATQVSPWKTATREISSQTRSPATQTCQEVQTESAVKPTSTTSATQATPRPGVNQGVQAEDQLAEVVAFLRRRVAELEALLGSTEIRQVALEESLDAALSEAEVCQQAAFSQLLGKLNITILCPKAECTIGGDRIEMDSWNPARLREEFELEVLPRFSRLFVEEVPDGSKTSGRSHAVEQTMQEFAEVFRQRLASMLSAQSATSAVGALRGGAPGRR